MLKNVLKSAFAVSVALLITACGSKQGTIETLGYVPELDAISGARNVGHDMTNVAIVKNIGEGALITSSELSKHVKKVSKNIIVTSIVNVGNFEETSDFGRIFSEASMTNFKRLGWNVIDFRAKQLLVKSKDGEFYLNRTMLKDIPTDSIVFVGTYGEYQNGLLVNVRLLDKTSNYVLSASNVQLNDANALALSQRNNCNELGCTKGSAHKQKAFKIGIVQDDCANPMRCECDNPNKCLNEKSIDEK